MTDDVIPRYLVMVNGIVTEEFDSEVEAVRYASWGLLEHSIEVVRSIRRWEIDTATGEMLEVGEKLREQSV